MATSKSGKLAREEREKIIILTHKFENRITIAKFGKEALDNSDYSTALRRFVEYMEIMAEVKKVRDIYSLNVAHFNPKKDVTELLMISHVFFEMARIYDAVPKFQEDSQKCLDQFVHFSANQPFQVVNSELIRKHLKKSAFKNQEAFRVAYQQIFVQSKKCYIVSFCYGTDHPVTQEFRVFKDWLLQFRIGQDLVRHYYFYSSVAVARWEKKPTMHVISKLFIRPTLSLFAKTVLRFILPRC